MSFNLQSIQRNKANAAPRIFLYGVEGIGKSTFGAMAPNPIFIPTEDGLGQLDVDHFPLCKSTDDIMAAIGSLYEGQHDFKTVVLDSVDWAESFIFREMEARYDAKDLAYGKGAVIASEQWRSILEGLDFLRNEKGMTVILIAHCQIKRFESPEVEPFDRYQPKLQDRSSAILREWADAVLFANWQTVTKKEDAGGFNKERYRGISTGQRLLHTSERPAHMAKNRYSLPDTIPLDWNEFNKLVNPATAAQQNAA